MPNYIHTSLGKGHESEPFVYTEVGKKDVLGFHKEYLSKDYDEQDYGKDDIAFGYALHHMLAAEEGIIERQKFKLDKKTFKGIKVRVLDKDPHAIYSATRLSTKEDIYCTQPEYIKGRTLGEFKDTTYDQSIGIRIPNYISLQGRIESYIKELVSRKAKEVLGYSIHIGQLNDVNMKVVDTESDEYLHVVVTDLFAQYNRFVIQNEKVLQQAKNDLFKLFQVDL